MTKLEIITTFNCKNCQDFTDDSHSIERFRNIIYLNITAESIAAIVNDAQTKVRPSQEKCSWCKKTITHDSRQNWIVLPEVLILALNRFQDAQFAPVAPTANLNINGVSYILRSVICHYAAEDISKGWGC